MRHSLILRGAAALFLVVCMSMPVVAQAAVISSMSDHGVMNHPQKIIKKNVVKKVVKKVIKKVAKKKVKKTVPLKKPVSPVVPAPNPPAPQQALPQAALPDPTKVIVAIQGFAFAPGNLTIKKGTTVTFTNNDNDPHTVTAVTNAFASDVLTKGQSFSFIFDTVGIFEYFCAIHSSMRATITVTE